MCRRGLNESYKTNKNPPPPQPEKNVDKEEEEEHTQKNPRKGGNKMMLKNKKQI